ncbi:MAG: nuclear transport factor 2 family protein [Burkholderiaceae bacterium]
MIFLSPGADRPARNLNRQELIDLVVNKYFSNVDGKNHQLVLDCFAEDAVLRVQSADVEHHGHEGIGRMFSDFMNTPTIHHGDFTHIVDVEAQTIASQFVAINTYDDGGRVEMRNCNFFDVENGLFKRVTIYMTDENPLV